MPVHIETPRLLIRELLSIDDLGMYEMDTDPEVHKYIGKQPIQTIQQSRDVIEFVRRQYIANGIGRWAVIEKTTNSFTGWVGFKLQKEPVNGHHNFYDFGYRFQQKHWNKGYASESGRAVLNHGIHTLRLKTIYAMTDVDNGASRHVLEKLGFRLVEVFRYDAEPSWRTAGEPTTWYKLDSDKESTGRHAGFLKR